LIFVDGDDCARALHADDVLNRAADAKREIEFCATVWPELPIWRSIEASPRRRLDETRRFPRPLLWRLLRLAEYFLAL